jgi:zinc transport system substrate-binding protein
MLFSVAVFLTAGPHPASSANPPLKTFVSIAPQAYLVERVGGPSVSVDVLVGPGQNHHTFEPTPKQLADLAGARIYFRIGLPFENRLMEKIQAANAALQIVDTRTGLMLRRMEAFDDEDHDASATGGGAVDPHVWLSPANANVIAANIAKALRELDPARAAEYDRNLGALQKDLDDLNARVSQLLAPFRGNTFYVYHPAFGYFADAYGLKQAAVEIEGKEPTARQLARLIAKARAEGVRVIFVQQQFPKKAAETIANEVGGAVIPIDPLARDYLANLEDIALKIRNAWEPRRP